MTYLSSFLCSYALCSGSITLAKGLCVALHAVIEAHSFFSVERKSQISTFMYRSYIIYSNSFYPL